MLSLTMKTMTMNQKRMKCVCDEEAEQEEQSALKDERLQTPRVDHGQTIQEQIANDIKTTPNGPRQDQQFEVTQPEQAQPNRMMCAIWAPHFPCASVARHFVNLVRFSAWSSPIANCGLSMATPPVFSDDDLDDLLPSLLNPPLPLPEHFRSLPSHPMIALNASRSCIAWMDALLHA